MQARILRMSELALLVGDFDVSAYAQLPEISNCRRTRTLSSTKTSDQMEWPCVGTQTALTHKPYSLCMDLSYLLAEGAMMRLRNVTRAHTHENILLRVSLYFYTRHSTAARLYNDTP